MNILNRYTVKTLKKNRMRTIVTIIGIILSVSMITAVTTLISSLQNFLIDASIANSGEWHGVVYDMSQKDLEQLRKEKGVLGVSEASEVGYAKLSDSKNEVKPYLYVQSINETYKEKMSTQLVKGRFPKNSSELIIPENLADNGRVKLQIGQSVTLDIGTRTAAQKRVNQNIQYLENGEEKIENTQKKTYTIVGIMGRVGVEPYGAPGYSSFTVNDEAATLTNAYIRVDDPNEAYTIIKKYTQYESDVNKDLLRFLGASNEKLFNRILYGLAGILIGIIVFASVSLIYNAFSISVSERTKQFGLISSLGATRRQLKRSVYFEAGVLSIIAIPIGLLAGVGGIGITLKATEGLFSKTFGGNINSNVTFHLSVSWEALVIAVLLSIFTVLLSAYIPCRRALKRTAIDSIRQAGDIKIKGKKVKTSRLVYRLFGFEGMIASKNFKRNKSKYRATVISLFVSIVLFISANSFGTYLRNSASNVVTDYKFDIMYNAYNDNRDVKKVYDSFINVGGVDKISSVDCYSYVCKPDLNIFTKPAKEYIVDDLCVYLCFLDSTSYHDMLKENHLDDSTKGVGIDTYRYFDNDAKKYASFNYFNERDNIKLGKLTMTNIVDKVPMGMETMYGSSVCIFYDEADKDSIISQVKVEDEGFGTVFIKASDHKKVTKELQEIISQNDWEDNLTDLVETIEVEQALLLILDIFTYGFIILISLIAVANVFNTISTNILLRKREFAVLRSIGLTKKGFHKMMNFECLLYGIKSILWGIPVSLLITYFIYLTIMQGIEMPYLIPWDGIIISIVGVFAIVFTTMLYSTHKVNKENTIDALKNENL